MPRKDIDHIREKIRLRQYDMSAHAMEEMAEDLLTIMDVEESVLKVRLSDLKKMTLEAQNIYLICRSLKAIAESRLNKWRTSFF